MTEMHAGFDELPHRYNCHGFNSKCWEGAVGNRDASLLFGAGRPDKSLGSRRVPAKRGGCLIPWSAEVRSCKRATILLNDYYIGTALYIGIAVAR